MILKQAYFTHFIPQNQGFSNYFLIFLCFFATFLGILSAFT
ncbi:hypothetical protein HFN_0872 [Helicobacter fennelliae MRY12-0050]|uniref:Uncharacterized protein n=1 Tax=Helicobacter fennelliae MRY12-0050 TaxID=1325130 RepID=T1DWR3_9HELI|nr:hypothetical protein HFN_0872 [Helicobacter fennelliae MRY12-0050]